MQANEMPEKMPLVGLGPLHVGLRYLRSKKLSYLAIVGVALAVGVLIVVMSIMSGFSKQLLEVIRGYHSDLTIRSEESTIYGFKDWETVRRTVLGVPHVQAAAPFIEGLAFIRFPPSKRMLSVGFRGIEPELERQVTGFGGEFMLQGRLEDVRRTYADRTYPDADVSACLIGSAMVRIHQFYPGVIDCLLMTATRAGDRRFRPYRVAGLFETGSSEYDAGVVLLSLESAMEFVRSEGGVSGLSVKLDDYRNAPETVRALEGALGAHYGIMTWKDHNKTMVKAVAAERFLMALILGFVGMLAGFCIFAILTMTVAEKRRDIGILKAVGASSGNIAATFLIDGAAIGIFGSVGGVIGGQLFCHNINAIADFIEMLTHWEPFPQDVYFFSEIPADTGLLAPAALATVAIACSLIFSVLPAVRAARLDPIETLRYE